MIGRDQTDNLARKADARSLVLDERETNPYGFKAAPSAGTARLTWSPGGGWIVESGGATVARLAGTGLPSADVAKQLHHFQVVTVDSDGHHDTAGAARIVAGLAACGVPLAAAEAPGWAHALLGDELAGLLTAVPADGFADGLCREEHSVRLRRCALRTFGKLGRTWPEVSVLLATNRPQQVPFALDQIARQRLVDLEVVLALHGVNARLPSVAEAVARFDRPLTVLEFDPRAEQGTVLNSAADRAAGRFLAKMDDDDWYGPEHLADMVLALRYSGADLAGCGAEFVYLSDLGLTLRRSTVSEQMVTQVAGSTMVWDKALLAAVGGFRPGPWQVDASLLHDVQLMGGQVYRTHALGFVLGRRTKGHTWQRPPSYYQASAVWQRRGFVPSTLLEATDETLSAGSNSDR